MSDKIFAIASENLDSNVVKLVKSSKTVPNLVEVHLTNEDKIREALKTQRFVYSYRKVKSFRRIGVLIVEIDNNYESSKYAKFTVEFAQNNGIRVFLVCESMSEPKRNCNNFSSFNLLPPISLQGFWQKIIERTRESLQCFHILYSFSCHGVLSIHGTK